MITGRLGYNVTNERYGLLVSNRWEIEGIHCGQTLEVFVDGRWIPTRMEIAWNQGGRHWYLVDTPYYGDLGNVKARFPK